MDQHDGVALGDVLRDLVRDDICPAMMCSLVVLSRST